MRKKELEKQIENLEEELCDMDAMQWELEDLQEQYRKKYGKYYEF